MIKRCKYLIMTIIINPAITAGKMFILFPLLTGCILIDLTTRKISPDMYS